MAPTQLELQTHSEQIGQAYVFAALRLSGKKLIKSINLNELKGKK